MRFSVLLLFMATLFLAACNNDGNQGELKDITKVEITTPQGRMVVALYNETPQHRDNFLKLVRQGYYDSLLFHRVIRNFMIQGGDPKSKYAQPTQLLGVNDLEYTVPAEIDSSFLPIQGALAAARKPDPVNPSKASSAAQFFIVHGQPLQDYQLDQYEQELGLQYTEQQRADYKTFGGAPFLHGDYTIFGMVIEGRDVLDKIANVETRNSPPDRPVQDIRMQVRILNDEQ